MIRTSYNGCLLAAHPRRKDQNLDKAVMFIVDHDEHGTIGYRIDKKFVTGPDLASVMSNLNIDYSGDDAIFKGGSESVNRLQVIHTLDWSNKRTLQFGDNLGVSYDVSILTAIAKNQGPERFRVIAGYTKWPPGHLEGEIAGKHPWRLEHSWIVLDAKQDLIFDLDDQEQWRAVINHESHREINSWFSHVRD